MKISKRTKWIVGIVAGLAVVFVFVRKAGAGSIIGKLSSAVTGVPPAATKGPEVAARQGRNHF